MPGNEPIMLKAWCGHPPESSLLLFMSMLLMPKRENTTLYEVRPYATFQFRVRFVFVFHGKAEHV